MKYPLLRFVRRRFDVQATLFGVGLGFVGGLLVLLYVVLLAYGVVPPVGTRQQLLEAGVVVTMVGAGAAIGGLVSLGLGWAGSRLRGD